MPHLTYKQIQDLADGPISQQSREHLAHVTTCRRCEKELAMQRAVVKAARETRLVRTSSRFTKTLMTEIDPASGGSWLLKILGGSGKVIGMAAVLGAIGYALVSSPAWMGARSEQSEFARTFAQYYDRVAQFISSQSASMGQAVSSQSSTEGSEILAMTILSVLALVLLDRLILKPFMHHRH